MLLAGCVVAHTLVERAQRTRRLTHDEQIVLAYSLGYSDAGVDALNALFATCPEIPHHAHPKRPQRGHPISCARIRARIPETTSRLPCHCDFDARALSSYPSPLLHVREPPSPVREPARSCAPVDDAPSKET